MKYLKPYSESIKHLLKPKNKEDISKSIEKLDNRSKLLKASEYGILSIVKDVINDDKFNYELDDFAYSNALFSAVYNNHIDIVRFLLQFKQCDPTYLSMASIVYANKNWKMLDLLLKDERVIKSLTPYQLGIYTDRVNYELNRTDESIKHLLTIASENWYTEIYNYLQNKFNTNESIKHLLKPKSEEDIKNSIMNSNSSDRLDKIFRFKLNHLFSDDEILEICKDLTPDEKLYKGTRHNIPILIKQSILDGVNTGKNNQMLIKFASQNGYSDIIEMLLKDDRVNPIVHNNLPIAYAAENGHLDAVKVLMNDKRVDPSDYNNAAIKYALKNKHLSVVKQLMNDKRVVDKLEPIDKQNIRIELEYGYKSLFKDIERKMKSNESIKHFLKPKSKEDILKSIEKLSPHEKLQHACEYGILWLFKQSLDEGANPAYQDNYPIRYASAGGYYTIVKILLSLNGVNPSDLNNSAIVMAYYYKHKDIVELLLNDKRVKNSLSKYDLKRYKKYIKFDIRESLINEFIDYEVKYWALYYHIYDNFFSKLDNREEIQELRNKLIDEFGKELAPVINFFADYRLKKLDI